ncbi:MAG: TetR family transcriptional regulator [Actinomycetota bacterium]
MDDAAPQGLRERRRLDTQLEIHEAALSLFEQQGLRATTVQQIADRAGVSHRTFFRYFSSKEQAAIPGQRLLLRAFETLELDGDGPGEVLRAIERVAIAAMADVGEGRLEGQLRITRLLAAEPDLQASAAGQDLQLIDALRERLGASLPDWPAGRIRLVAELSVATWRTAWQHWGECAMRGDLVEPADVFRECSADLRLVVGASPHRRG